jgi:hypothetical protein
MKFFKLAGKFHTEEDGAVTVDWVVLTAAVVGLGLAALAAVRGGMKSLTGKVDSTMSAMTIQTTF